MASFLDREHFIPIRVVDLIPFLADGAGATAGAGGVVPDNERDAFRRFARLVQSTYHQRMNVRVVQFKEVYGPFDPDADTIKFAPPAGDAKAKAVERVFADVNDLLVAANYKPLSRLEAMKVMEGSSAWGVEMDVEWGVFDRIEFYYRGDHVETRYRRKWWKLWKKEEIPTPSFSRLVVVMKQQPHKRLGSKADTEGVYVKMFKDLPKCDMEMVLPGTKIKMTRLDKAMILYPLCTGLFIGLYALLRYLFPGQKWLDIGISAVLSWPLAGVLAGYAYKSYFSYTVKKTNYTLKLTQNLYYQNINTNAGVLSMLIDEAEEQEVREVLLSYAYLLKHGGRGMTAGELDDAIEQDLERRLGVKIDFEIEDGLGKLERLALCRKSGDRYSAVPLAEANKTLERMWLEVSWDAPSAAEPLKVDPKARPLDFEFKPAGA